MKLWHLGPSSYSTAKQEQSPTVPPFEPQHHSPQDFAISSSSGVMSQNCLEWKKPPPLCLQMIKAENSQNVMDYCDLAV